MIPDATSSELLLQEEGAEDAEGGGGEFRPARKGQSGAAHRILPLAALSYQDRYGGDRGRASGSQGRTGGDNRNGRGQGNGIAQGEERSERFPTGLEKKRVKLAVEVNRVQPSIIKSTDEIKNLKRKIKRENIGLDKTRKEVELHEEKSAALRKEIEEYGRTDTQLQEEYEEQKRSFGSSEEDVTLTEEQEAEYEQVREAAAVASAKPRQALNVANKKLNNAQAKTVTLSDESKELTTRKEDAARQAVGLTNRMTSVQLSYQRVQKGRNALSSHIISQLY